jgi:hypothetical protein
MHSGTSMMAASNISNDSIISDDKVNSSVEDLMNSASLKESKIIKSLKLNNQKLTPEEILRLEAANMMQMNFETVSSE